MGHHPRQALGKDASGAVGRSAKEAAGLESQPDGPAAPGQIGDGADVAAADAVRDASAGRTRHRFPSRRQHQDKAVSLGGDVLQPDERGIRQPGLCG